MQDELGAYIKTYALRDESLLFSFTHSGSAQASVTAQSMTLL